MEVSEGIGSRIGMWVGEGLFLEGHIGSRIGSSGVWDRLGFSVVTTDLNAFYGECRCAKGLPGA